MPRQYTPEQKQRNRDSARRHYYANREEILARAREKWAAASEDERAQRREYFREYRAKNKAALAAKDRERYAANPEKWREYARRNKARFNDLRRKRQAADKEKYRATRKKWLDANREDWNERARRHNGAGSDTNRAILLNRDGAKCGICGSGIDDVFDRQAVHVDHIVPVARGGGSEITNLQLSHASCNHRKRDVQTTLF